MDMEHDGVHLRGPVVCRRQIPHSKGIWYGDNPIDYPYTIFLMQMVFMSIISQLLYFVLRPLKQPKFVCYAISGMLVGPHVMRWSKSVLDSNNFFPVEAICAKVSGYLGGIYLLFLVAVKVDVANVRRSLKSASTIGLASFFFSFTTILGMSFLVNLPTLSKDNWFHGMFAISLSVTRLPSVVYTFNELNILTSELGQLAMSTSMLSEVLSAVWLLVDLSRRHKDHLVGAVLSCVLFVLFMVFAIRPSLMWIIRRTPDGKRVSEVYIVLVLAGALGGALVADIIGSVQFGVIVMGLIIPNGPPLGSTLTEKVEFFVLEVLLPMMYLVMGYDTNLYSITPEMFVVILVMVFIGLAAKMAGTLLSAMARGLDSQHALLLGLMLNVKGPFDVVPFVHWKAAKSIDEGLFAALVVSQVIVTAIVAPIIDRLYRNSVRVNMFEVKKNMRAIQLTPLEGELRIICCVYGEEHVPGIINLLQATNLPTSGRLCAYIVNVSELGGRAVPVIEAHDQKNQLRKVTSRKTYQIMQAFDNYLKPSKTGSLLMKAYNVTAPYKSMHEYICKLALNEKAPLIIVPFPDATQQFDLVEAVALRNVNSNVHVHAPCTVGILVDRSARFSMSSSTSPRKIAVLFFGGADDREAMCMGTRMSSHPTVSVTVLRFITPKQSNNNNNNNGIEDQIEHKLDQQVISDFKVKNAHNSCSLYYESVVPDAEHAMDAVRSLKSKYNLVIVGYQGRGTESMFGEMLQWSENPELGVIGDFLASPDFSSGLTAVLVMQHYGDARGAFPNNNGGIEESQFHRIVRID